MNSLWILMIMSLLHLSTRTQAYPNSLPGCIDRCGNMSIPYPFGTTPNCYLDDTFLITCDTTYDPPKAFLGGSNINITEIMLLDGQIRIMSYIAHQCFKNGTLIDSESNLDPYLTLAKFPLSYSKNKFTVVGCDVYASFTGSQTASTGCSISCSNLSDVVNGTCTGLGCCQMSIPKMALGTNIYLNSFYNHTNVSDFDPCSYAFVVEESNYTFNSLDFFGLSKVVMFPVILDWSIGNQTCEEAIKDPTSYACKENSHCLVSDNGPGYRCNCNHGYEGSAYLPNGCQDECKIDQPCNSTCQNLPGSYLCSCPKGYIGDGKKDGQGCILATTSDRKLLTTALGISISISVILMASVWLFCVLQQRKLSKLKRKYFQQNGGLILQQLLAKHENPSETFSHYTSTDLMKATNNYHETMILGQGGQGTVYKGILPNKKTVAVKKSNVIDKTQMEQFINEVIILSQINHRNVVKLLGCCLETEVPMLVYEFITNGTLFSHIQVSNNAPKMPWQTRLRIASETAKALSYLHSDASVRIIHRDVKTTNILLDESYAAKVSDFGTSKFAPVDRTSLTTLVQGTFGYLDPGYFFSSQLTEKSDVYSFGVVLVELITGEMAVNFDRKEEERSLAMYFVSALKEDRLFGIIEGSLKREENVWQLNQVAIVAASCLRVRGEDRPTMKEVATELEALMKMNIHPWVEVELNEEESEVLLGC
ncbi:hypothetical protein V2J09_001242 [Rumex salicifolius]